MSFLPAKCANCGGELTIVSGAVEFSLRGFGDCVSLSRIDAPEALRPAAVRSRAFENCPLAPRARQPAPDV